MEEQLDTSPSTNLLGHTEHLEDSFASQEEQYQSTNRIFLRPFNHVSVHLGRRGPTPVHIKQRPCSGSIMSSSVLRCLCLSLFRITRDTKPGNLVTCFSPRPYKCIKNVGKQFS